MRLFFQAFPNCDALRSELSRTHYRRLLRVEDSRARAWYMDEAAGQNWSTRALERQSKQLFASKYRLILPSEEELRREIESARVAIQGA